MTQNLYMLKWISEGPYTYIIHSTETHLHRCTRKIILGIKFSGLKPILK